MASIQELIDKNYIVYSNATIKDAMIAMSDNHRGAVIVVGEKAELIGVAADGDIRRALVRGQTVFSPIESIVNRNPIAVSGDEYKKDAEEILLQNSAVHMIPVVTQDYTVVDVIIR